MKVAALWTGGKDSSLACYKVMKEHEVPFVVTFIWEKPSSSHPLSIIKLQAEALKTPFLWYKLKAPYFESYRNAVTELKKEYGIEAVVTGDISYVDAFHGNWIDDVCKGTGVQVIKPLWEKDRKRIMEDLLSSGFKVMLTCVKEPWMTEEWLGKVIDWQRLKGIEELHQKNGLDICGEFGEYHTMTIDAPYFTQTIQVSKFTKQKVDNAFIMEPVELSLVPKIKLEEVTKRP